MATIVNVQDPASLNNLAVDSNGRIGINNFPSVQTVVGTVNIAAFPAVQPVNGTIDVTDRSTRQLGVMTIAPGGAMKIYDAAGVFQLAIDSGGNASTNLGKVGGTAVSLGSKASASSIPVVIASDQGAIPISGSVTATNPSVGTTGSGTPLSATLLGASDGTNLQPLQVESSSNKNVRIGIYQGVSEASVGVFHNSDAQSLASITNILATGGAVAYLYNPSGLADRQRSVGIDAIPAMGVQAGGQQLAGPALTTTFNGAVTGSGAAQSVVVASSANAKIGDIVTTGDNVEQVEITAIADSTHVTGIFKNNHANGQSLTWYHYNQARDATVGDNVTGIGLSPSATYLYNNISGNFEFDRSANGEKDGASGQGTAIAAEYEWNAGGPLNNSNIISGLQFDRARNLQGKGLGSGTISNNPLAAGSTILTLSSAPATLLPGQQVILDRAGANPEANYVGTGYTVGSTSVPLQNATAFSHAQNSTVEWDQFAGLGPQLSGFTPAGIGIEEEALFNPVDGKYYIERSATQDGVAAANVVMESPALWNGTTMDRMTADPTGKAKVSLYVKKSANADTVLTLGSATSANSIPVVVASDQGAFPVTANAGTGEFSNNLNQVNGAALSNTNPVLTEPNLQNWLRNAQIFTVTTGAQAGASQTSGACLFNANQTKNVYIFSVFVMNSNPGQGVYTSLRKVTTNPSYTNTPTPVCTVLSSTNTSLMSPSWQASATVTGTDIGTDNFNAGENSKEPLMVGNVVGRGFLLGANANSGLAVFVGQGGTGGAWSVTFTYAEF